MLWQGRRESSNVDDRRGIGAGGMAVGGGILGVIALLINFLMGGGGGDGQMPPLPNQNQPLSTEQQAAQDTMVRFVKVVLAETENVWHKEFSKLGMTYQEPRLEVFSGSTQSACGFAQSATGPFYCPGDQDVYIDLSFYDELRDRFGAPGDFAMAYVIAHEIGHHVQNLMGVSEKMQRLRGQVSQEEYNQYSVRVELQADFYAGLWAHYMQGEGILERNDINEALAAANAIGDDRIQKESQGYVVPEKFTHGTSAQRMYWFKKGFDSGDIRQGDTFSATNL